MSARPGRTKVLDKNEDGKETAGENEDYIPVADLEEEIARSCGPERTYLSKFLENWKNRRTE